MQSEAFFDPPVLGQVQPLELCCVELANVALWGDWQIWPAMRSLKRLMATDQQAPRLLSNLVHQSHAQRSSGLVYALKACLHNNQSVTGVIQEIGSSLKNDRLQRHDAIKDGDTPGIEAGMEVIYRTVEDSARPRS